MLGTMRLIDSLTGLFIAPSVLGTLSAEEEHRHVLFGVLVFLGLVVLNIFGFAHLVQGDIQEGLFNLVGAALASVAIWLSRFQSNPAITHRIGVSLFALMVICADWLYRCFDKTLWRCQSYEYCTENNYKASW